MRNLLACTCLTPIALIAFAAPASAERVVDTAITTPLQTATATNGAPDSIRVTANGSITLTSGTAITVNSIHDVTNLGAIAINNANDATGILIGNGTTGTITNTGTIRLLEDYTPTDTDNDGDIDGPLAQGSNRFGIRMTSGSTHTGNVVVGGTIEVEGNNSGGVALDGHLVGALTSTSSISVTGNNAVGIRAGEVTGNVAVSGVVAVRGQNAVGVDLTGNIGGRLTFQGSVIARGFRTDTPPTDQTKLDADDLLRGGPAIRIAGDVTNGIIFAVPPADKDPNNADEDADGVPDAQEGSASIASIGDAAAVEIGAAGRSVTIGGVPGNGRGLVIDGAIAGAGTYSNVDGNAVVIGGQGGTVVLANGMSVNGTVTASSPNANATALRIGAGASVPDIAVGGTIRATGGADVGDITRAIFVQQGASVTRILNTGRIEATGGTRGTAEAIVDRTGGLVQIDNSGAIVATGGSTAVGGGSAVAIDLSANTTGTTIRQLAPTATGAAAPRITGDILLGSGNDVLDVARGTVTGTTRFGAGDNRLNLSNDSSFTGTAQFGTGADRVTLAGTSRFSGTLDFGGGNDLLEIGGTANFSGAIRNSGGLDVRVTGGTFRMTETGNAVLRSLTVGNGGIVGVDINGATGLHTQINVAGEASFAAGSRIGARLLNISQSEGRFVVLRASTLTGAPTLGFDDGSLPFLFTGRVETNSNEVAVIISRRTATALGLNRSQTAAYDAIFDALDKDAGVAGVFLALGNAGAVRAQFNQMLPDHAGGVFETVTLGSRATARFLADPHPPVTDLGGGWGFWLQQAGFGTSKDLGDTAAYDVSGYAASGGAERRTAIGSFGASLSYLSGDDANGDNDNNVRSEQYELAGYWRGSFGNFRGFARVSAATLNMTSTRYFTGTDDEGRPVSRTARGEWSGQLYSAAAGLSYDLRFGRFTLRPAVAIDYYRLSEDGYAETEGGDGLNLTVDGRTSDELAGTVSLSAGYEFGSLEPDGTRLRAEIEGGRRQILGGALGATVARFDDGDPFTLTPEERTDGFTGAVRLVGGQNAFSIAAEALAEEQAGRASVAFRVSLGLGF